MDSIPRPTPDEHRSLRERLASLRLRFADPELEREYRADRLHLNIGNIRFAFLAGIALWIGWGILLRRQMLALADLQLDLTIRFGVFIPMLVLGLVLSYTRIFARVWEAVSVAIAVATIVVWVYYSSNVQTLPAEFGYVGVILITSFTYALLRLRFILVVFITVVGIAIYLPYAFAAPYINEASAPIAALYLFSFGMLGAMGAYWMERFTRALFVRERQLDQERQRSDRLLSNILPQAVIEQLKTSPGERVAQAFDEVSVVFVDAVGSTEQAARTTPEAFASALDELFRHLDELADRHGLEKIKTIGDGYMAVAGAPVPMPDPSGAAVAMAFDILNECRAVRWPSGDRVVVRGGVATGPAVAGIIGERKFAYDVWGDTVNLASRLEEQAEPGEVLVSEPTATKCEGRFGFGPVRVVEIKGKGPTRVRALLWPPSGSVDGGAVQADAETS
jgi:class 3 adenylate cyclase